MITQRKKLTLVDAFSLSQRQLNSLWLVLVIFSAFLLNLASFRYFDFYHQHFFDHGYLVSLYLVSRLIYGMCFFWMIYAVGQFSVALIAKNHCFEGLTSLERIVIRFGVGASVLHILLFTLGLLNLYYYSVMLTLACFILILSIPHAVSVFEAMKGVKFRDGPSHHPIAFINAMFFVLGLIWLLIVRALYPGGGGDYFTHYFYYYLNVLNNHGLMPNDVWYHFYYSKGAGLYFFSMLLTDPESPALVTFCFVLTASCALYSMAVRLAPRSFWPLVCALIYVLYNLLAINGTGGEFQKIHEETSAFITLAIWTMCLYQINPARWQRLSFILLTSVTLASAILTQAVAVYLGLLFGLMAVYFLIIRRYKAFIFYFSLGSIALSAVLIMLGINYWMTGMVTDQALNFAWKFANLEKLDAWGVLPNVMLVAWIRDNYDMIASSDLRGMLKDLISFLRLDNLKWVAIVSAFGLFASFVHRWRTKSSVDTDFRLFFLVGSVLLIYTLLSFIVGRSQAVSYFRFSSFFVPLWLLLAAICWSYLVKYYQHTYPLGWMLRVEVPLIMLVLVIFSWPQWSDKAESVTRSAISLITGDFSIADGYAHQPVGLPFGGINPGAYKAYQQVPKGSRIWATNVDSYCMAPQCQIESVISFKLSSRLHEILTHRPDEAAKILKQEGLNYFIFSKDSRLLDILVYSKLFHPNTIKNYFSIKWTDGSTYLLTWKDEKNSAALSPKFLREYKKKFDDPESSWFLFSASPKYLNEMMLKIYHSPHPWAAFNFPWRNKAYPNIKIDQATYGLNCKSFRCPAPNVNLVQNGNASAWVSAHCNGKKNCVFTVTEKNFADPANGCLKDFDVYYHCGHTKEQKRVMVLGEALGKKINLTCEKPQGMMIKSAAYGKNCTAKKISSIFHPQPYRFDVAAWLRNLCDNKKDCRLALDFPRVKHDPMKGCAKDLEVLYQCHMQKQPKILSVNDANHKDIHLYC